MNAEHQMKSNPTAHQLSPAPKRASSRRRLVIGVILAGIVFTAVWLLEIVPRKLARAELNQETAALSVSSVAVVQPKTEAAAQELVLPGNMQALQDTPIFARTNGYLKRWYADIGTHVKVGQLLAEIEIPEVDDQLKQARANRAAAEANYELAKVTATRWQELLKTNAVAKQATDQAVSAFHANEAALQSARFNVAYLEKLVSFARVYAPFDGVISVRNIDVGALITAGSAGGPATELFHIADTRSLRVYVNVPQGFSQEAQPGIEAELELAEFPGRRFKGTLVRNARAIDPTLRTLLTEVDVDNPTGELLPGGYAQVHLSLQSAAPALILPANTLLFRPHGVQVGVVGTDGRVALTTVTLGRDFGTRVEVVSGLRSDQSVVLNPPDALQTGQTVRVVKDSISANPQ
jgi:RND family efflux transporter MFP subunit